MSELNSDLLLGVVSFLTGFLIALIIKEVKISNTKTEHDTIIKKYQKTCEEWEKTCEAKQELINQYKENIKILMKIKELLMADLKQTKKDYELIIDNLKKRIERKKHE